MGREGAGGWVSGEGGSGWLGKWEEGSGEGGSEWLGKGEGAGGWVSGRERVVG